MSISNHLTPSNNPEDGRIQFHRCWSLRCRIWNFRTPDLRFILPKRKAILVEVKRNSSERVISSSQLLFPTQQARNRGNKPPCPQRCLNLRFQKSSSFRFTSYNRGHRNTSKQNKKKWGISISPEWRGDLSGNFLSLILTHRRMFLTTESAKTAR